MDNIYSAPKSNLSEEQKTDFEYAGFWIRFVASFVDGIGYIALGFGLGWLIYGDEYFESTAIYIDTLDFFISDVVPFLITMGFWLYYSATPGKLLVGIKIVDAETHQRVAPLRLLLRYIGYFVSMLILFIGYFMVAWDDRKQALHDKMARTVVIKTR